MGTSTSSRGIFAFTSPLAIPRFTPPEMETPIETWGSTITLKPVAASVPVVLRVADALAPTCRVKIQKSIGGRLNVWLADRLVFKPGDALTLPPPGTCSPNRKKLTLPVALEEEPVEVSTVAFTSTTSTSPPNTTICPPNSASKCAEELPVDGVALVLKSPVRVQ